MKRNELSDLFGDHPLIPRLNRHLASMPPGTVGVEGLAGSSKAVVIAGVFERTRTTQLVIIPEKEDAAYLYNDLLALAGDKNIFFFPSTFKRSVQYEQTEPANIVLRTEVLNVLSRGNEQVLIVTYPESVMEKVTSRENLNRNTFIISKGDKLSIEFLEEVLNEYNFERVDFVNEPGQYSIRGSIVDVFSYSEELPSRVDFFGNEVDSVRTFNTDDQLSVDMPGKVSIIPNIQDITIDEMNNSIADFLPPSTVIWIDNPGYVKEKIDNIFQQTARGEESGRIRGKKSIVMDGSILFSSFREFRIAMLGKTPGNKDHERFIFHTEPQPAFNKNFELLSGKLIENKVNGYKTIIVSESRSRIDRLKDIFSEINPDVDFHPILLNLHSGFTDNDFRVSVFTDHQIFDRYHKFRIKGYFTRKESIAVKELTGLNPGDYVVHIDHGIGKFGGLEKIEVNGKIQEAIKLVYRDNDILYVGIHSLHRISKYKGKDNSEPKIYKLGSGAWQKLKQTAKSRVKDIARDLIRLYARRMASEGYAFSPDSYLQRELEASFIYEDTPDQLSASRAVKEDMEASHPMDRLVCGDVGFGKTEVAVRAAFKSATDSRQTAILVPTTILALQHYKTFSERLRGFPCTVEYLTRHKRPAEQKKIISMLAEGKIDIIIGTHKLVGTGIRFKDLGLLIIDEEQRFGVSVKEKLKKIKASVDTLTLTATPIPRTLQFSLMGARDLSIINTPPPNRMPIVTEIHGFNDEIIREGIEYEVSRNGQVFIIHNRVENIKEVQAKIERVCPNVKCAVVHGKMDGKSIEDVMFGYIQGDYDVLIATTIIESGLDIPNANTIFINNAHHFGLSELHQLRGRVGRSNKKAFCYLLAPPLGSLTHEARRRLKAIEEYSELGSGLNIAMQDLDIRGSGNLLGGEQSGFIADMGFETYQRILNEAIAELRENEPGEEMPVDKEASIAPGKELPETYVSDFTIDTDLEIMFPDEYISSIPERIRLYKELNEIRDEESLQRFATKLTDRFGDIPPRALELLDMVRLKWIAVRLGMEKIVLRNNLLLANFISDPESRFYKSPAFIRIMGSVNNNHKLMSVKQKDSKLSITIREINSVKSAISTLDNILSGITVQ
jgi:transcription-repair coupling factor (superfamily II helicase)